MPGAGREPRFLQVADSCHRSRQPLMRASATGRRCEFTLPAKSGHSPVRRARGPKADVPNSDHSQKSGQYSSAAACSDFFLTRDSEGMR